MKNTALVKARKKMRLTQEELAILLGYSKGTVSNWENGYSNPSLPDAFKVSEVLGEDISKLFSGTNVQVSCIKGKEVS